MFLKKCDNWPFHLFLLRLYLQRPSTERRRRRWHGTSRCCSRRSGRRVRFWTLTKLEFPRRGFPKPRSSTLSPPTDAVVAWPLLAGVGRRHNCGPHRWIEAMKPLGLPHSSAAQIFAARYRARSLSWLSFGSLCRLSPPPLPLTILRPPFRDLNVHLRYFREMMDWAMTGIETYGYPPPPPPPPPRDAVWAFLVWMFRRDRFLATLSH